MPSYVIGKERVRIKTPAVPSFWEKLLINTKQPQKSLVENDDGQGHIHPVGPRCEIEH